MNPIDWPQKIRELEVGMTHQQIADATGMASSGHVSNLKSGLQKTISYDLGCKLLDLHRREMRKRSRAIAKGERR